MAAEIADKRVNVHGVEVTFKLAGQGAPLVYLHGAGGSRWSPGLDLLAERLQVYLPEHPGFGTTERPEWLQTMKDMARFYRDLFQAAGLTDLNLVGQSLGGWLAAELAILDGSRLRRLVLVDAAGLQIPGEDRPNMFSLPPSEMPYLLYHDQELARQAASVRATPEQAAQQARNREMAARLGADPYLSDPSLEQRLPQIKLPTLILWGAQDRLIPPTHGSLYARSIAGARLQTIKACGHSPHVEQPVELARLIGDFLDKGGP